MMTGDGNSPDDASPPVRDNEAGHLFWYLSSRYHAAAFDPMRRLFKSNALLIDLSRALTVAPVIEDRGFFQIDPAPRPPKKAWRWIVAVRWGAWDDLCCWGGRDVTAEQREALNGLYCDDLLACDQSLLKVTSRLVGNTAVCGWPQEPWLADKPVHVHESPLAWLLARGAGVFLCSDHEQQQTWLRQCTPGLTTNTVAMGETVMRKMRRPIPALPPVRVYA